MKFALALILAALPADCQLFSVGIKAGLPLTNAFSSAFVSNGAAFNSDDHYTVGATGELHFFPHLALEMDVLYRRNNFSYNGASVGSSSYSLSNWQVPILLKAELPLGFRMARPFIDGGLTYRHLGSGGTAGGSTQNSNNAGVTIGGGLVFKLLSIHLSPEIRYTSWRQTASTVFAASNGNQADFLVGLTF